MKYNDEMEPRKTLPKPAIFRIYKIDQEISKGRYPNAPFLAEKLFTSLSSINRDIAYMRDMLDAPIEYDFFKKGFYYKEKTFRLSASYASAEDLLALSMAKSLLELYRDTPIYGTALNLLENISVPIQGVENTKWLKERFVIPPIISVPVKPEVWQCIISGMQENKVITFMYFEIVSGKKELKRVHPYQLVFDRTTWHLFAFDEEKAKKRMFTISRISNTKASDKKFTIKGELDYRKIQEVSFFTEVSEKHYEHMSKRLYSLSPVIGKQTGKEKVYKFAVEITEGIQQLKKQPLTEDQQIVKIKNGARLTFTSNQFEMVLEWVLSQGANTRPIQPKLLVTKWSAVIKKMAKLAGVTKK